jgi:hypothetical protein
MFCERLLAMFLKHVSMCRKEQMTRFSYSFLLFGMQQVYDRKQTRVFWRQFQRESHQAVRMLTLFTRHTRFWIALM